MKKITVLCAAIACLSAAPASAATPYVSGSVGLGIMGSSDLTVAGSTSQQEYKTGVPFSGAVGLKSGDVRCELAVGHQKNDVDGVLGGDVSVLSIMANAYYDINLKGSSFSPYVMAGLGDAKVKFNDYAGEPFDKSGFAWQIGTGVGLKASEKVTIDLGYRYFKSSKVKENPDDGDNCTISSSNILLGLRYGF
ncbi:MAG: outer membrane beta-barrel protein [Chlorobiaceae bacterium]